jgi:CRP-like cAMP-binding protein
MTVGTSAAQLCDLGVLEPLCRKMRFSAGDVLREAGHHYRDMYLIAGGSVAIQVAGGGGVTDRAAGSSIGEIEFLQGCAATATATARTATEALVIDDATLARLEAEHPFLSAQLLGHLAQLAEEAAGPNKRSGDRVGARSQKRDVEVYLCRTKDMLTRAQRLRYEVYCQELHRNSPYADHRRRIIADELDQFGHTFVAVQGDETIGTLRGNLPSEGPLGALEELYGMRTSLRYPTAASVCTKFIVKKAKRGGATALKLISAMVRYGLRQNVKECYADCVPPLLHYYRAIGFEVCGSEFLHPENGRSYPLMLDLAKHGGRLSSSQSVSALLGLYLRAKATKLVARLLGNSG